MDDVKDLIFQNGELTAEVRMLKIRLDEANSANSYLLHQVGLLANDNDGNSRDIVAMEREHNRTLGENSKLKAQLGIMTRQRSALTSFSSKKHRPATLNHNVDNMSAVISTDDLSVTDSDARPIRGHRRNNAQDFDAPMMDSPLLDLSDSSVLTPERVIKEKGTKSPPKTPDHPTEPVSHGLNAYAAYAARTPTPIWEQNKIDDGDGEPANAPAQNSSFNVINTDGSIVPVFTTNNSFGATHGLAPPFRESFDRQRYQTSSLGYTRRPVEFTDHEYRKLSGEATFIEPLSDHEYNAFWHDRAREKPRHTASEWREYYETNVRPAYLKKMEDRRDSARSFDSAQDSTQETSPEAKLTMAGEEATGALSAGSAHNSTQEASPAAQLTAAKKEAGGALSEGSPHDSLLEAAPPAEPTNAGVEAVDQATVQPITPLPNLGLQTGTSQFKPHRQAPLAPYQAYVSDEAKFTIADLCAGPKVFQDNPLKFRTVSISIPPGTKLEDVTLKIRVKDGTIYEAYICETSKMRTKPPSEHDNAIVIFIYATAAQAFLAQSNGPLPVQFVDDNTKEVFTSEVKLLNKATWKIAPAIMNEANAGRYCTRILYISPAPQGVLPPGHAPGHTIPLEADWTNWVLVNYEPHSGLVKDAISMQQNNQGMVRLEYGSMKQAIEAHETVGKMSEVFGEFMCRFGEDPCGRAASQEELAAWAAEIPVEDDDGDDMQTDEELSVD